ncbi:hypothetical protein V1Y59_14340 [Gordonia sp. PKS22-38]|uniref:Diacylglycerol O-acyltransferase n=1 Tax=Gordonia prachuapensis TaxID=3115651 RepID=A0ABU7MV92_9ACTN|nr:hypothetical protein [Gordonia sp. PKS22-38]
MRIRETQQAIPRVTGADESYLMAEELLGMSAPIQYLWVFEDDPGPEAVDGLRHALATGSLHRAVRRTRIPVARHRWVASTEKPVPTPGETIDDSDIGTWADRCLRAAELRPVDGRGWQVDSAITDTGGRVVSLLVSHMITDGQGLYHALAEAHSGRSRILPAADTARGGRALMADVVDAARQLAAAARSLRILAGTAIRNRGGAQGNTMHPPTPTPPNDDVAADTTLAIVDVDRQVWHDRAREHQGTANGLFTALLGGVVQRSGFPVGEQLRVCIAVDNRADELDDRANASGGVWIRLSEPIEPGMALDGIRAMSKQAFVTYAESGSEQAADNLQPVVRLLPRRVIARMMRTIPGPDTTVSNLGVAPSDVLELGGVTASRFGIRAIMQGVSAQQRRRQGPAIAAWAVEYGDRITLTFFGVDPDHFGDTDLLRKLVGNELSAWRLEHRFW